MKQDLEEQVALITGGASGIGAATAKYLAKKGARLALLDRDETKMRIIAEEIALETGHKPIEIVASVDQVTEVARAVTKTFNQFKRIDILVNCAGISLRAPFLELKEDVWDNVVDTNLKGTFLCCQAVAPIMVKQHYGVIINISSDLAARGAANLVHYTAAKAGIIALTKSIAIELGPHNIRVNAIAPGMVDTPLYRSHGSEEGIRQEASRTPLRRIAQPDDIANTISFLVSPESLHITGQTLYVNGGALMI